MVSEGRGRLFRRKDGKYLLYIPKGVAQDSQFPFKADSVHMKVSFTPSRPGQVDKLLVERWVEPVSEE